MFIIGDAVNRRNLACVIAQNADEAKERVRQEIKSVCANDENRLDTFELELYSKELREVLENIDKINECPENVVLFVGGLHFKENEQA